jgi:hypothetical protein
MQDAATAGSAPAVDVDDSLDARQALGQCTAIDAAPRRTCVSRARSILSGLGGRHESWVGAMPFIFSRRRNVRDFTDYSDGTIFACAAKRVTVDGENQKTSSTTY